MAIIQPDEIAGLPELFEEVRALRRELDLLKAGRQPGQASEARGLERQVAGTAAHAADDGDPISMSPEDIRERVGTVVGERGGEPQAVSTSDQPTKEF